MLSTRAPDAGECVPFAVDEVPVVDGTPIIGAPIAGRLRGCSSEMSAAAPCADASDLAECWNPFVAAGSVENDETETLADPCLCVLAEPAAE